MKALDEIGLGGVQPWGCVQPCPSHLLLLSGDPLGPRADGRVALKHYNPASKSQREEPEARKPQAPGFFLRAVGAVVLEDTMFEESAMRSVIKAFSWRILATVTTALLVYAFTGRTDLAVTIGILEGITKMGLYYLHERIWNRLNVGRRPIFRSADGTSAPALASSNQDPE